MKKLLGLLAVAGLMFVVTPSQQASAMSLTSPGVTTSAKQASGAAITEVRWRRHWHPRWHRRWHRHHW